MKLRTVVIVVAVLVVIGAVFVSWTFTSVSAAGKFQKLADGTIRYTHSLTNNTWHPVRYIVAADPQSPVTTTLARSDSSNPEKTVTRTGPTTDETPWSVTLLVPGHQEASIEVIFQPQDSSSELGLSATTDMDGVYPAFRVLLQVNK